MTALPADERLWCTCGRELAITEIAGRLTLSHKVNPTFQHHYPKVIRLASRAARNDGAPSTGQPEAREDAASPLTTNGYADLSEGRTTRTVKALGALSSGIVQLPAEGGSQRGRDPYTAPTLRSRQAAGRP